MMKVILLGAITGTVTTLVVLAVAFFWRDRNGRTYFDRPL